jgi:hypothetical protein
LDAPKFPESLAAFGTRFGVESFVDK